MSNAAPASVLSANRRLTGEPVVHDRTWTEWQVRRPGEDAIAFASEDRAEVEKWMFRLSDRKQYVLAAVERRTRSESWYGSAEVVPWHSPCSWAGAVGDPPEALACQRHGWHRRDEPVPDEFWIPAPLTGGSAPNPSGGNRRERQGPPVMRRLRYAVCWLVHEVTYELLMLGYQLRPYDSHLDRRRWRWERSGCMRSRIAWRQHPDLARALAEVVERGEDPGGRT